jgi:hypothetical protein
VTAKQRQNLLAVLAIGIIALWAGDKFVLTPLIASWKERAGRIKSLETSINRGHLLQERDTTIHERWQSIQTNSLPADSSAAENELFTGFDRWSKESQISVVSIKPQWRPHEDYMTLQCRAEAYGNMQALTRFLYDLEKDPLPLKIESIQITARDKEGQDLSLALEVSGLQLNLATAKNP